MLSYFMAVAIILHRVPCLEMSGNENMLPNEALYTGHVLIPLIAIHLPCIGIIRATVIFGCVGQQPYRQAEYRDGDGDGDGDGEQ